MDICILREFIINSNGKHHPMEKELSKSQIAIGNP